MNCRKLAKLMPELAAGELDAWLAQDAREHLASCPACAGQYEKYAADSAVLSGPWERHPIPGELATLTLPERAGQRSGWLVPVAAAACILLMVICFAHTLMGPTQTVAKMPPTVNSKQVPIAPTKPTEKKSIVNRIEDRHSPTVRFRHRRPAPSRLPPTRVRTIVHELDKQAHVPNRLRKPLPTAQQPPNRPPLPNDKSITTDLVSNRHTPGGAHPELFPAPLAGESSIEIRSTDTTTGAVTIYRCRRESPGGTEYIQLISRDQNNGGGI